MGSDLATAAAGDGRPRVWPLRVMLNAIFFIERNGSIWRDLPPWKTVDTQFWRWRRDGTWEALNAALAQAVRQAEGREPQPSAAVIDSQSVKTREGRDERGVDVYKPIAGRKRHLVVDTRACCCKSRCIRRAFPIARAANRPCTPCSPASRRVSTNR
jgi:transposase